MHKIHLREASNHDAWADIVAELAVADQADTQRVEARVPVEGPKSRPDKADTLREEWAKLTDTHQFLRLCSKLKMNRLGAYRIAGAPWVRPLAPSAADAMLHAVRDAGIEVMLLWAIADVSRSTPARSRRSSPWGHGRT